MNIVMVDTDYNFCLSLSQFLKGSGNIDTVGIFEKTSEAVSFFRSTNKKMELQEGVDSGIYSYKATISGNDQTVQAILPISINEEVIKETVQFMIILFIQLIFT